ncbi:uncharacterized protein PAC_14831 [Phialocephala subalpina]|uniref:DUF7708 domain-containing protein n=1 Tax=Phialocephala subalpina TaxID=576137 RepID=A0A1L7XIS3_9HELO|nr:uncharacterized protein PAC_14831 [Phialocephala subalpina]
MEQLQKSIITAYRDPLATADRDVALEAYTKAVEYFTKEFAGNTKALSLLAGHNSILDVVATLEDAKKNYDDQGQKRKAVFKRLNTLSLRIRYYSGVLGALAQRHPEYVALAWGSIKLVLMVKLCSDTINAIASGAGRAEIRDIHITTQLVRTDIQGLYQKLHEMQVQFDDKQLKMDGQIDQVLKITTASKVIPETIQLDILEMKPRVYDIQFLYIIAFLSPKAIPETILHKHSSTVARHRHQTMPEPRNQADIIKCLGQWVSKTCLLHVYSSVIRQDPNVLVNFPEDLNAAQFSSDHTEVEWLTLLCLLISRLDKCFLVIETEDLCQSSREDPEWTRKFVQIFQHLLDTVETAGSLVKALIVTFDNSKPEPASGSTNRIITTVQQPRHIPPRLRHGASRSKGTSSLRHSLSRKV